MSSSLRDRLKQVETDTRTARDELAAKNAAKFAAIAVLEKADTDTDEKSPEYADAMKCVEEAAAAKDALQALVEKKNGLLTMLDQDPAVQERSEKAKSDGDDGEQPWVSKGLFDKDIRTRLTHAAISQKSHLGNLSLGEVASRDAMKADITGTVSMRRGSYAGIVPQIRRRIRLLDLISIGMTDGNSVPYTQQSGTYAAAETAESALKPESGMIVTDVDAPVRTIAAWQKIPKQVLSDYAALQSIIDDRLRYEVLRRAEAQIIGGTGTSPNLTGILNTAGIGTVGTSAGRPYGEAILAGITQVANAEGESTAVVVNPSDWQTLLITKTSGSGEYLNQVEPVAGPGLGEVGGAGTMIPTLWGVPVVTSTVIAVGTALVGDFTMGAQLFIREGVNVLMSDSDGTDFTQNRVTILAEMRAALAVWQPSVFSKVTY